MLEREGSCGFFIHSFKFCFSNSLKLCVMLDVIKVNSCNDFFCCCHFSKFFCKIKERKFVQDEEEDKIRCQD